MVSGETITCNRVVSLSISRRPWEIIDSATFPVNDVMNARMKIPNPTFTRRPAGVTHSFALWVTVRW